jgi:iron complex transport system permease protein
MDNTGKYIKKSVLVAVLLVLGFLAMMLALGVGSSGLGLGDFFRLLFSGANTPETAILYKMRLPRAILAYLVGAGLSVSGVCLQALFKNPMADPHMLGVSTGAGLGVAILTVIAGTGALASGGLLALCAFGGGLLGVSLVYKISGAGKRGTSVVALLLSGIAISTFFTALVSLLMVLNRSKMDVVMLWTMGSFSAAGWGQIVWAVAPIILGTIACMAFSRDLNIMLLGEEEARQLGVNLRNTRRILILLTTLITASAVSVSGIIGFVGLMVPHMMRLMIGPDHKWLLPASFFGGGAFLVLVDTFSRTIASPLELPIGIITGILGVPFFLYLLTRNRRKGHVL